MRTAILLLLLVAPAEWAQVPKYKLLQSAKLVVAGEVVELGKDAKGHPLARLKVELVLKGKPESEIIELPFKTETSWACDFTISYVKGKKYLLLLDDLHFYRVVYFPGGTHDEILGVDDPSVKFAQLALDVMNGVNLKQRMPELLRQKADPEALPVFRCVPRALARPYLADIRAAFGTPKWKSLPPESVEWRSWSRTALADDLEMIRDLSYVSDLIQEQPQNDESLRATLSLLTGWNVRDWRTFEPLWKVALRRAEAHGSRDDVKPQVKRLGSTEAEERDQAFQAILDLGPDVLETVKALDNAEDLEVRQRIAALIRELELLKDLKADLDARKR